MRAVRSKDLRQARDPRYRSLWPERVKDRILEYLAVQSRVNKIKGQSFVWWDRRGR